MKKVVIIDPTKCRGCLSCMIACATLNDGTGDLNRSRIRITPFLLDALFFPSVCQQCEDPLCAAVCPVKALIKDEETGVVQVDESKCIGCKLCLIGCPFGNLTFLERTPAKCTTCDGDPVCVRVCEWQALTYGEADEIGAGRRMEVAQKLRKSTDQTPGNVQTL